MKEVCIACHNKTVENLLAKFNPDKQLAKVIRGKAEGYIRKKYDNPYLATLIHRMVKEELQSEDLYFDEKLSANKLLLNQYEQWKAWVGNDEHSFRKAAILAVSGNIIDYGAHSVPADITKQIKHLVNQGLAIDESEVLKEKVEKAKSILYLGDNAGEIVFDKLFIETMNHRNISYAVRGKTVINDVTIKDAELVGMDKACKVISNGYDAPSTLLDYCSDEFLHVYHDADLIISKGQGNFEGLMHSANLKIFFMLMAKCEPMAEMLGVRKGDMVVKKLKQ